MTPSRPSPRRATLMNVVTLLFFLATLGALTVLVAALLAPPPLPEISQMPTVAPDLPTLTATATPTVTPTSTATLPASFTPRPTETATPTASPTATRTSSPTPVTPSSTPSNTATPTPSHTPTETPVPFPFVLRGEVTFRENFANTLECAWQGIGGAVYADTGAELSREALSAVRVRVVAEEDFERFDRPGSNSFYGTQSGYEIVVDTRINSTLYYVRLESEQGRPLSPEIQLTFPASCTGNLAVVEWMTNARFAP